MDGTLIIPKKTEKLIKESIKQSKLKELELLRLFIKKFTKPIYSYEQITYRILTKF